MSSRRRALSWLLLSILVLATGGTASAESAPTKPEPKAAAAKTDREPVDLNRASASDLESVPGIGAALALRIVEFREKNGPFARVEDLVKVQGVGEKSLKKISPYLTVTKAK